MKGNKKKGVVMKYLGIDIGSTNTKVAWEADGLRDVFSIRSRALAKDTLDSIDRVLKEDFAFVRSEDTYVVATGYGRVGVDYADKSITEITCHAIGSKSLMDLKDATVIDIGGQDMKVIALRDGMVEDFLMNDKCSAGTGKFVEVMAQRMEVSVEELFELAKTGKPIPLSSTCTVFAESEIVSCIGAGEALEDIAAGIISTIVGRVAAMTVRLRMQGDMVLTGGFSHSETFIKMLEEKIKRPLKIHEWSPYAGAVGALHLAKKYAR